MRHLGLLSGTFDPIHEGHIALARAAVQEASLDKVLLIPIANPSDKDTYASLSERLDMCRLAAQKNERIEASDAGVADGNDISLTILKKVRKIYPDAQFTWLIGEDKLPKLPYLPSAKAIFSQSDFLCCRRAGVDAGAPLNLCREAGADIQMLESVAYPGSSALIRARCRALEDSHELDLDVSRFVAENGLYQPDYREQLRAMMNERRYRHTLGVRKTAVHLAFRYGCSMQKAAAAGYFHDCAKGMPQKVMRQIALEHHLTEDETVLASGALMHGMVGAVVAQEKFGIKDEGVLDAIRYHTIGRKGMTTLDLCIFVADAIEPTREDYEELSRLRALSEKSLRASALLSLYTTRDYLTSQGKPFFRAGNETIASLEEELTETEKSYLAGAPAD